MKIRKERAKSSELTTQKQCYCNTKAMCLLDENDAFRVF